ncbi:MAG: YqjF family protein [Akkermansiaceae bacterium]
MSTPTTEQRLAERCQPDSPVVMKQVWSHLLFLHWQMDPAIIQETLPQGLTVDTHEDNAYLGIVPFFMEDVRPSYCPALPGISWFQELNLRTYVHDDEGRPGVWFYTLDCNQWLAVKIARTLFHLPYQHASMESYQDHGTLTYISRRKRTEVSQIFKYPATLDHPCVAETGSLDFFLLERYRLFSTRKSGSIYSGQVHHKPYEFERIQVVDYSTELFSLCGFEPPECPPVSALIAQPVKVDIHPLSKN